jgi:hypothetical protein
MVKINKNFELSTLQIKGGLFPPFVEALPLITANRVFIK